jgi:AcrR family transcriptional regulator
MQFHQGSRLKHLIEKSGMTVAEVSRILDVARTSLYNLFEKKELLRSQSEPILKIIQVDPESFYGHKKEVGELESVTIEALKREIELLKEQLAAKDEIILLLKTKNSKK